MAEPQNEHGGAAMDLSPSSSSPAIVPGTGPAPAHVAAPQPEPSPSSPDSPPSATTKAEIDFAPASPPPSPPAAVPQPMSPENEKERFRFYIRGARDDFGVRDLAQLQALFHSGFLGEDDEVRRAGTNIWRRAGAMPELGVVRPKPWLEGNEVLVLTVLLCVATLLMVLIFGM